MNEKAFRELLDIIHIESDGFRKGSRLRREALLEWVDTWIEELTSKQLVLNYNQLSSEFQDEIKERLALAMITDASQESEYTCNSTHVTSKMYVIRRNKKKRLTNF